MNEYCRCIHCQRAFVGVNKIFCSQRCSSKYFTASRYGGNGKAVLTWRKRETARKLLAKARKQVYRKIEKELDIPYPLIAEVERAYIKEVLSPVLHGDCESF